MGTQDQRPRFFEGQYLSADDLTALAACVRTGDARHALAGHTWGIVTGLGLVERSAPGAPDRVETLLVPGFGWDGFGRPIAVTRPTRLPESLFAGIAYNATLDDVAAGGKGRLVRVWLAYEETLAGNAFPGLETCAADDTAARITEGVRFVIGEQPDAQQRSPIVVGTDTLDARDALQRYDPSQPTLWDASVPQQTFPTAERPPRWLLPIGFVRWIARDNALGYFARRDLDAAAAVEDRTRAFRRYAGVVAESVEAADGAIVLHRRGERPDAPHRFARLLASGRKVVELLKDLVWVEGHLRVGGDAKLAGGALHLRDADGDEQGTPMSLARRGDDPASGMPGRRELRVVIGDDTQADNRFVVGPVVAGATPEDTHPRLAVVSNGDVGIGRRDPETRLNVVGERIRLQDDAAGAKRIDLRTAGDGVGLESSTDKVSVRAFGPAAANKHHVVLNPQPGDGNVGVGVANPTQKLHVAGTSYLDGQLGVGVALPAGGTQVHVRGPRIRLESQDAAKRVDLRCDGSAVDLHTETSDLYLRSSTPPAQGAPSRHIVMNPFPEDGNVGVGTSAPLEKLHVAGRFLRVDGAGNEQAYLGGDAVANDVQLGSLNPAIDLVALYNPGSGQHMNLACRDIAANWLTCAVVSCNTLFTLSDERAKEEIQPIGDALSTLRQLRGVTFRWRGDSRMAPARDARDYGLIAQEVAQVLPELVQRTPAGDSVSYVSLIPLLLEGMKELQDEVAALRSAMNAGAPSAGRATPAEKAPPKKPATKKSGAAGTRPARR